MMRRLTMILMIMILMLSIVACGNGNENSNGAVSNNGGELSEPRSPSDTTSNDFEETDSGERTTDDYGEADSPSITVESKGDTESELSDASKLTSDSLKDRDEDDYDKTLRNNFQNSAGTLTAGQWNDNENYEYFMNILNDNDWYHMQSKWQFVNWDRYEFQVMNQKNQAILNAKVELYSGQEIYYTGYTDNKGYAVLYPFINQTFIQSPDISARISYNNEVYEILDLVQRKKDTFYVTIDEKSDDVETVDVMFMIDTTGSMGDELEYLKVELEDVIRRVRSNQMNDFDLQISGNYYRDYDDEYIVRSYPFTSNVSSVISEMDEQWASGGGDYEEAVVEALDDAINKHQWRHDAEAKLLFLVLDAPPHNTEQNVQKIHQLIKDANAQGIRIIPIASSGVDKDTEFLLRFLDITTGGTYIFLTDHSGVGGGHITPTIGQYKVEQLNDLLVEVIQSYIK